MAFPLTGLFYNTKGQSSGLPKWLSSDEPTCQCRKRGFDPWVRKISWRRKCQPLQYSCLGNPMDRGAWWGTVHGIARAGHDSVTEQQQQQQKDYHILWLVVELMLHLTSPICLWLSNPYPPVSFALTSERNFCWCRIFLLQGKIKDHLEMFCLRETLRIFEFLILDL